jgi:hypothetical protein
MHYLTQKQFKALSRNPDGDVINLYGVYHRLTETQIDQLTGDDWSRVIEYQLENDYFLSDGWIR